MDKKNIIKALHEVSLYDVLLSMLSGILYLGTNDKAKEKLLKKLNDDFGFIPESTEERKAVTILAAALGIILESVEIDADTIGKIDLKEITDVALDDVKIVMELEEKPTMDDIIKYYETI